MSPSQALFDTHMQSHAYQIGAVKGQWGLAETPPPTWPVIYFWIAAASRQNLPDRYYFRFNLESYPTQAPTACPWDILADTKLPSDQWPKGGSLVASVFRHDWNGGNCLYAPCDRLADLPGHANWATQHPQYYWKTGLSFVKYLEFVYDLLNSGDYAPE